MTVLLQQFCNQILTLLSILPAGAAAMISYLGEAVQPSAAQQESMAKTELDQ